MVVSDVLGVDPPLGNPAVLAASRVKRSRPVRQASRIPFELLLAFERDAACGDHPFGFQLYCASFLLMAMASIRFADTMDVLSLWRSDSALFGRPINHKDKQGELMTWATPLSGLATKGAWAETLLAYCEMVKPDPEGGKYVRLFPRWAGIGESSGNQAHTEPCWPQSDAS